jgi:hypothetical protein
VEFRNIIFGLQHGHDFDQAALEVFRFQYRQNEIYRRYADAVGRTPETVSHPSRIPFLPVSFFKSHDVISGTGLPEKTFLSSGTTGAERSRHPVSDLSVYRESLRKGFARFYGSIKDFIVFALTPDPVQNPDSSLIYMIHDWIMESGTEMSGFYYGRQELLAEILNKKRNTEKKTLLIGLSYALLDFTDRYSLVIPEAVIIETGGMKGRRKEMVREELHSVLSERFGCRFIHSEYGMTELLSQAYSKGEDKFNAPPWMRVLIRDPNDPMELLPDGRTGGINIIDLANFNSCSFIEVQDIGRINKDGTFEVLGRFDFSDLRGCSLMIG